MERIENRITLPLMRRAWIARGQLLELLRRASDNLLTIVVAGPGYGKSGLMSLYASQRPDEKFIYLALSNQEKDPAVYEKSLIRAFEKALGSPHTASNSVYDLFDIAVNAHKKATLILDSYEKIEASEQASHFTQSLLKDLPQNAQIIIASRVMPKLRMGALMQDMSVIGHNSFRLTDEEIQGILAKGAAMDAPPPTAELVRQAKNVAGGWLTGTRLYAQLLSTSPADTLEFQLDETLNDYFQTEVLDGASPDLQDFALKTSLLSQVTPEACQNSLGIENSASWIAETRRQNLFVNETGDGNHGSFVYLPLFASFLQKEYARRNPHGFKDSHKRIAFSLSNINDSSLIIEHLLAAQDYDKAAQTLLNNGASLLQNGLYKQVLAWMNQISPHIKLDDDSRRKLEHFTLFSLIRIGKDKDALALIQTPADDETRRNRAFWQVALDTHSGNYTVAAKWADARATHSTVFTPARLEADMAAARSLMELGQLQEALKITESVLSCSDGMEWKSLMARAKILESDLCDLLGDTARAFRACADAVAMARLSEHTGTLIVSLMAQARRLASEGEISGAERALAEASRLTRQSGSQGAWLIMRLDQTAAWFALLSGRLDDAIALSNRMVGYANNRQDMGGGVTTAIQIDALEMRQRALLLGAMLRQNPQSRLDELSECALVAKEMLRLADNSQSVLARRKALLALGASSAALGDYEQASRILNEASVLRGQFNDAVAGAIVGWQYFIQNSDSDAQAAEQAAALLKELEQLHIKRGNLLFLQQEGERVWSAYKRSLSGSVVNANLATDSRSSPGVRQKSVKIAESRAPYQSGLPDQIRENAPLTIYGFGTGRAMVNGELVTITQWGWSIPRELLIYMLTVREATRERMGSIFWPDSSTLTMQRGFHNAKFTIRTVVGIPPFLYSNGIYTINPELNYWYDVQEFDKQINEAARLPPEMAMANQLNAASLYKDDFLLGSNLEWADNMRQKLRARYLKCCLDLGETALALNSNDSRALTVLENAFQMEPLREDLARVYMKLLLQTGRKGDAIEVYRALSTALKREVNVRPDSETEMVYRSALSEGRQPQG